MIAMQHPDVYIMHLVLSFVETHGEIVHAILELFSRLKVHALEEAQHGCILLQHHS